MTDSANLDLVRSIYADWERGDFSRADWADPDIEFVIFDAISGSPARSKGLREMARGLAAAIEMVGEARTAPVEYRELDTERMLVFVRRSSIGKRSGIGIEVEGANLFQISEGKVTRLVTYWDRDRALADLGLEDDAVSEESTTPDLVDLVRRYARAASVRDYDAWMRFWAPDGVLDLSLTTLGTYEGHAAIRAFIEEWLGAFDDFQWEVEEVHDLGNGVAFAVIRSHGRPVGSSGDVQMRFGSVSARTEGLVVWERHYTETDFDEARAAAERLAEDRE
jgi:ketosteroid isomerase-like protein